MRHAGTPHAHGELSSAQLTPETWADFEKLFASNGGVWGGCWCMYYHRPGKFVSSAYERNREAKHALVKEGGAHGTIVYCGREPVGWCQFGPGEELARIDKKRGYAPTAEDPRRITCLFVAPGHRGSGLARLAIAESVRAMRELGVRTIEAYPVEGESEASSLWAGTPQLYESAGFSQVRRLGKRNWIYTLGPASVSSKGRRRCPN